MTVRVRDLTVQLAVLHTILLSGEPPDAAICEVVVLQQCMHLFALVPLLPAQHINASTA